MNLENIIMIIIVGYIVYSLVSNQITEYYNATDPVILDLLETISPLFDGSIQYRGILSSLNERRVLDEVSVSKSDQSYTINKKNIYLCLEDPNGQLYNKNMLVYVTLHEISHVICDEIGHTSKFAEIFDEILKVATEKGIYNPSIPIVNNYCPKR